MQFRASDALAILAGTRINWREGKETSAGAPTFECKYSGEMTPYLGFTYDIDPTWTAYGSWTSIYKPQLVQDADGNYLDPTYGYNYELGVKAGLLDDVMYTSAAIFQTNQKDVAEYLDWDPVQNRSIGGNETRGFERETADALNDRWNVSAGYTSAFPRITTVTSFTPTSPPYPEACHRLPAGWRSGGQADAGRRDALASGTDSIDFASEVEQPNVHQGSYAVFYFTAAYEVTEKTELSLTVNNILNKKYFATTGFYDTVVYGDERSAELTLRARF